MKKRMIRAFIKASVPITVIDMYNNVVNRKSTILHNVNKTSFQRTALISYTIAPFIKKKYHHSNSMELFGIVEALKENNYNVDIINYDNERKIDYNHYSLVFGFGEPLENSFRSENLMCRICYATGTFVGFQNQASSRRGEYAKKAYGKYMVDSLRLVNRYWPMQISSSDVLITLGNGFAAKTFEKVFRNKIYTINGVISQASKHITKSDADLSEGKANYLWFGSAGFVHKGLDLLLEYFSLHQDVELHVCASLENERTFCETFRDKLHNTRNIHVHGFVDVSSEKFADILRKCDFAIFPTCSEGCSSGTMTVMYSGGLIPVVTKESGISTVEYGIEIEDTSIEAVGNAIEQSRRMSLQDIKREYECLKTKSAHCATFESFKQEMKTIISEVIGKI